MRRKAMVVGAGLMLAASVAMAGPASAAPVCAGTADTVYVCVEPFGGTYYNDCVYVGAPPCRQVIVNGPTATCGGPYAGWVCSDISVGE